MKVASMFLVGLTCAFGLNEHIGFSMPMSVDEPNELIHHGYEIPGNICIVNTKGSNQTFDAYVLECASKKHSWFKISIDDGEIIIWSR
jgi:hypothetical protein